MFIIRSSFNSYTNVQKNMDIQHVFSWINNIISFSNEKKFVDQGYVVKYNSIAAPRSSSLSHAFFHDELHATRGDKQRRHTREA